MNLFRRKSWSPYAVGAGIGILSWFAFATAHQPVGITTAFENVAALAVKGAAPDAEPVNVYNADAAKENRSLKIDWEVMLVVGVFLGAWISAKLSQDRTKQKVPPLWHWRFGPSAAKRFTGAFLGGALMMFGARLAGGCTSGHGISGALQLAVSSWIFIALFLAAAVATAFALYGREARLYVR
jgi:uncharacterized protein